jgi:hypothetical protein
MPNTAPDRPINTLAWEDRYPARYDEKPADLSAWRDLAVSVETDAKKQLSKKHASKPKK